MIDDRHIWTVVSKKIRISEAELWLFRKYYALEIGTHGSLNWTKSSFSSIALPDNHGNFYELVVPRQALASDLTGEVYLETKTAGLNILQLASLKASKANINLVVDSQAAQEQLSLLGIKAIQHDIFNIETPLETPLVVPEIPVEATTGTTGAGIVLFLFVCVFIGASLYFYYSKQKPEEEELIVEVTTWLKSQEIDPLDIKIVIECILCIPPT